MFRIGKLIRDIIINFLRTDDYYVSKPQYYNSIPDKKYLFSRDGYEKHPYPCYGINFFDKEQLSLCEKLSKFAKEINQLPEDVLNEEKNKSFRDMDLEFLYGMIRFLKPKHFIEIGAGWSTLIAMQALNHNNTDEAHKCEHIVIEPYARPYFKRFFNKAGKYIPKPIQEVPASLFDKLTPGDILFIDTSHIVKYGGDINYLFFHIIPRLSKGCFIHIHDIFIPNEYFKTWIYRDNLFYTEQYLVMAFLMYNEQFQIRIAAQYLSQKYRNKLNNWFPRFQPTFSPGSLWLEKVRHKQASNLYQEAYPRGDA